MTEMPLLSLTIFLPLLGAFVILLIKEDENEKKEQEYAWITAFQMREGNFILL